ncbi:GntR family transcriptional regulator [Nocardia vaccinii]|uniref:GntR family transcriptional regulator n=1 Tax=Nocardia vaccinii TaxID=1822 RepID=UPI000A027425|nr:GntR family transcriptional regulator [Nocardia vaccinii]
MQFRTQPARQRDKGGLSDRQSGFHDQLREVLPAASHLLAHRLHDALRAALRAGAFDNGRLPAEPELMAEYQASRDVVREALDLLRRAGLIERRQGVGTLPTRPEYVATGAIPPAGCSLEDHLALGRITPKLLHWAWIPVPKVVSDRLTGVDPSDDCLCIEYVFLLDDRPLGIFTNYLRSPEAARIDQVAFVDDFYSLLDHGGVDIDAFDIGMQAASADDCAAALLHVLPGEPVMLLEQSIRNRDGEVVDYMLGTCCSDFQLRIDRVARIALTGALTSRHFEEHQ